MTEEQVTKALLEWLTGNQWNIVCYDFPQSGTGRVLHPNDDTEKNKGAIIPDIVAVKNAVCLFLENKNRFYYPDYEKQDMMRSTDDYSNDINSLLAPFGIRQKWFGIGLPKSKHKSKSVEAAHLVDFIITVGDEDRSIEVSYNPNSIVF